MTLPGPANGSDPEVTVVLMNYNEIHTLEAVAGELLDAIARLPGGGELVIVDDGSTDGSGVVADRIAAGRSDIRVVHHATNAGLGAVYRTGFGTARGRHLTFFPADGQFPAAILADFVPRMASADLVLGYLPSRRGVPIARALSALERALYRALLGPMPRFQGIFMIRREVLERLTLHSRGRGWAIVMELILRVSRSEYRVESRPTAHRTRAVGRSKAATARAALSNLQQILLLRRQLRHGR